MRSVLRTLGLLACLSAPLGAFAQDYGDYGGGRPLTGTWLQTYSTAGQCPTCSIAIRRDGDGYLVSSSNGWSARVIGGPHGAVGGGSWNTQGAWGGPLQVRLRARGDELELSMTAEWSGASLTSTYIAADAR
ncbi:hypothetical protein [Methylocystis sp. JR02]|uniref:hypothetical protein n=1 Tax=Methylocystis sp. JR02 TaxID=3046284 RepID=UPI0024BA0D6F|nr:hypothetical protein [Methylocystis sp. JR02]MDJ0448680.1 hypothetical protein [Methylocystis sp. JR02]